MWRFQNSFFSFLEMWRFSFVFGNFPKCSLHHVCFHGGLFNGFSSQKNKIKKIKLAALCLCVCLSLFKKIGGLHSVRRSQVPTSFLYKVTCCVRLSVTTGRREKWREKHMTEHQSATVRWRARFGNPMFVYRGPETQVLRAKCSNTAATEEESRGS